MIAGEKMSPAATAVDEVMNARRLNGTTVMVLSLPNYFYFAAVVVAAAVSSTVGPKRQPRQG
jgi:hypothetical protein